MNKFSTCAKIALLRSSNSRLIRFNSSTSSDKVSTLFALRFRQFCAATYRKLNFNIIFVMEAIFVYFRTLFLPRRRISFIIWSCSGDKDVKRATCRLYSSVVEWVISFNDKGILYWRNASSSCWRWLLARILARRYVIGRSESASNSI